MVIVYVDSNLLLQFRPLEELPLPSMLGDAEIEVVIPAMVVSELDEKKYDPRSERVRSRAKSVLRQIDAWSMGGDAAVLSNGARVVIGLNAPTNDPSVFGLSRTSNDDRILAEALTRRDHEQAIRICILTDDTGMRIKTRTLGMEPICPDEAHRLPEELDPTQAELARLRLELAKANQPAKPELKVLFEDGNDFLKFTVPQPLDREKNAEMYRKVYNGIRGDLLRSIQGQVDLSTLDRNSRLVALINEFKIVPQDEMDRFDKSLKQFDSKYEEFIRRAVDLDMLALSTFSFSLRLHNLGTAPAEDIDVHIHFPDGFRFQSKEDRRDLLAPPEPPMRPRTQIESMMDLMHTSSLLTVPFLPPRNVPVNLSNMSPPNVSPITIVKGNSYETTSKVRRLKHNNSVTIAELTIVFASMSDVRSFKADVTINAGNMREDKQGSLHFVFREPSGL